MKQIFTLALLLMLTACATGNTASPTTNPVNPSPTTGPLPTVTITVPTPTGVSSTETSSPTSAPESDLFTQAGISLSAPSCESGLTPLDTEGPYYKADTPERNSFLEAGMQGTRLILVGYVLDQNCQPIPNAWVDFWQADANGEYDNAGYTLRGHQFTDEQGRYFLETVLPGLYSSRPIVHLHVKVRPPNGNEITSQIYFPDQPVPNQTATLEERDAYVVGYFNFVVER